MVFDQPQTPHIELRFKNRGPEEFTLRTASGGENNPKVKVTVGGGKAGATATTLKLHLWQLAAARQAPGRGPSPSRLHLAAIMERSGPAYNPWDLTAEGTAECSTAMNVGLLLTMASTATT